MPHSLLACRCCVPSPALMPALAVARARPCPTMSGLLEAHVNAVQRWTRCQQVIDDGKAGTAPLVALQWALANRLVLGGLKERFGGTAMRRPADLCPIIPYHAAPPSLAPFAPLSAPQSIPPADGRHGCCATGAADGVQGSCGSASPEAPRCPRRCSTFLMTSASL